MKREVVCPKCQSEQISSNKRGYTSTDLRVFGYIASANEANRIVITCLMCGNAFYPGRGDIKITDNNGAITYEKAETPLIVKIPRNKRVDWFIFGIILFVTIIVIVLSKL
ncbi:hypothetical protein DIU36_03135 [Mucilaginibacter rubeus]|nr:hypothetical protein DIU36_03135 [Mucilaginibacter rubeus]